MESPHTCSGKTMMMVLLEDLCCKYTISLLPLPITSLTSSFLFSLYCPVSPFLLCLLFCSHFSSSLLISFFISLLCPACRKLWDEVRNSRHVRRRGCWEGTVARGWLPEVRTGVCAFGSLIRVLALPTVKGPLPSRPSV